MAEESKKSNTTKWIIGGLIAVGILAVAALPAAIDYYKAWWAARKAAASTGAGAQS